MQFVIAERSYPTQERHMALIALRGLAAPENARVSAFCDDAGASKTTRLTT